MRHLTSYRLCMFPVALIEPNTLTALDVWSYINFHNTINTSYFERFQMHLQCNEEEVLRSDRFFNKCKAIFVFKHAYDLITCYSSKTELRTKLYTSCISWKVFIGAKSINSFKGRLRLYSLFKVTSKQADDIFVMQDQLKKKWWIQTLWDLTGVAR